MIKYLLHITALLLPLHIHAAPKVLPVLNNPIADITANANAADHNINLGDVFGTEEIDDQVVRFTSQTTNGDRVMEIALFSTRTPATRTNFRKYVTDGDYNNSFIHRSMTNFVIQGGGFYKASLTDVFPFTSVPINAPVVNEFGVSNTYGTVSMAKQSGLPDSATSQWFASLGANSDILDPQSGGFTVFGRVTKSTLSSAEDFGDASLFDPTDKSSDHSAFGNLPLVAPYSGATVTSDDLILFPTVALATLNPADAGEDTTLTYTILSNSTPSVVNASITGRSQLQLSYPAHTTGSSTLTIRATDSVGNIVDDTFTVTLRETYTSWKHANFSAPDAANTSISNPSVDHNNDDLSNLELYVYGLSTTEAHLSPVSFFKDVFNGFDYPAFVLPVTNLNGITVKFQKSTTLNLSAWIDVAYLQITTPTTSGNITTLTLSTHAPATENPVFYRLHYTLTE